MSEEENLEEHLKLLEISSDRLPTVVVWDEFLPLDMNPFQHRPRSRSTGSICTCSKRTHQLSETSKTITKKNPKRLKDPVLRFMSKCMLNEMSLKKKSVSLTKNIHKNIKSTEHSKNETCTELKTLLDGCERLTIDSEIVDKNKSNNKDKHNASCSQEAIAGMGINPPCDVTMDELASYFETFVHIPKKMSSMAEMMYI